MKKIARLTALLVAAAMLSTMCAIPASADATTLTERFVETFDYAKGTTTSIQSIATANKYATSVGGEIIDNPYDATLGTSMKWASGTWNTYWSYTSGNMIKLSAPKMVISLKAALPEAGAGFGLKVAPRYEGDAENFSKDRGTGDILRIGSNAETGVITATTGGPRKSLGALEYGKMHEFTVVITNPDDAETLSTYDVYIDGELRAADLNYYTGTYGPANGETYGPFNIDGIRYIQGNGGGAIMDDIRVYTATASDIVESTPANNEINVDVATNSIAVKFETDVAADQMTTDNVTVSGATVSGIDRIDNKNYVINLAGTLASKTEYVVSFGNATDVLGNAITDTITFTSFDAGFIPTLIVGPNENFESADLGSYANMTQVNTQGMFSTTGDAPFDVKTNTIDPSLGKSAYFTNSGNVQTYWQKGKGMYEWYRASKAGEKIVVSFKFASSAATPSAPTLWVEGYSSLDAAVTDTLKHQVLRGEAGSIMKMGGSRPVVLNPVEKDRIYDVQYVFTTGEAGTAKCDLYIDGVYKNTQNVCQGYYAVASPLYAVSYIQLNVSADMWLDDLKLYSADGMAVEETIPADGATANVKNFITVKTSTPINFADTEGVTLSNLGNVTNVEKVDGYTAKIYFDGTIDYETPYTTKISGLKDLLGHTLTPETISFTTGEYVPYEVGDIAFTQNGNSVTATVDITNNGASAINPYLITAVYRGNLLIAVNWESETISTTGPITTTVNFTPEEGKTAADYTVRAYVWEDISTSNITPMIVPSFFTLTAAN